MPSLPPLPSLPALPQLPPLGDTAAGYPPVPRKRSALFSPVIAVVAVAALAGGGAAVWLVQRNDDPAARATVTASPGTSTDDPQGEATPPDPSASPEASASASASASPTAGAVPDGFRIAEDPKGFTLAVPDDWARSEEKTGVFFRSADRESLLQVFRVDEPELSPLDAVRGASGTLASNPGYTEVSVTEIPGEAGGPAAAELVYEYDGSTGSRRRGVERVFVTPTGEKYALLVRAPAAEWPRQQDVLAAALAAFEVTS
ncbi:hypothetical protein ACWCQL_05650 [Streptomyces sp. NPDC002073]|uniref:hypothetical protein n=1 Tax=Streptomyces sp. NBC_00239 TaxID=2903640 RepID=UPI002E2D177D|nr:hypothetical protein [Streptomyces sp. NBC_00239]